MARSRDLDYFGILVLFIIIASVELDQLFDQCSLSCIIQVSSFIIREGLSGMPAICP